MVYPTLSQVKKQLEKGIYHRIPLKMEFYADSITPIMALRRLKAVSGHCFLLESAQQSEQWGRYSFLGFDPILEITCQDGAVEINGTASSDRRAEHPREALRKILAENKAPRLEGMPPFSGGLVTSLMIILNIVNRACIWMRKTQKGLRMLILCCLIK